MKDAKGHGSDAHSSGVEKIGKEYSWMKLPRGGHVLAHNGNLADQLGGVHAQALTSAGHKKQYVGRYSYNGTGNNPSGYSFHGSVQGAKRYVESNIAKFWEPPKVRTK